MNEPPAHIDEWVRVTTCLHDARIAAMLRALMTGFATPWQPTHQEARDAREALMDEIEHLGVEPR